MKLASERASEEMNRQLFTALSSFFTYEYTRPELGASTRRVCKI